MSVTTESLVKVVEPATEEVMAELPQAGAEETDAAIERAKEAFPSWKRVDPGARGELMRRVAAKIRERAADLARLEARNVGKPISDARGEVDMVATSSTTTPGPPSASWATRSPLRAASTSRSASRWASSA